MQGRTRVVAGIASLGAALAIAVVSMLLLKPSEPVDPNTAAVRAAAQGALTALYFDILPPADFQGGPLPSPAAAAMRERVRADMERYFSPALQARYEPMILDAIGTIGVAEWDAVGGFSSLDWGAAAFQGNRATLALRESQWVLRRGGPDGRTPDATYRLDSTFDWHFTLSQVDGLWRVDAFDSTCVQGCP